MSVIAIFRQLSASETLNLPNDNKDAYHQKNSGNCCHNEDGRMLKGMTEESQPIESAKCGEHAHQRHHRIKCVELFREQSHGARQ